MKSKIWVLGSWTTSNSKPRAAKTRGLLGAAEASFLSTNKGTDKYSKPRKQLGMSSLKNGSHMPRCGWRLV